MTSTDDRDELIERIRRQDRIDDPTVGFGTAAEFESGSLVWPDERWTAVTSIHRASNERRDVWEYTFVRDDADQPEVPVAFVFDKTNEDLRTRVYYNKALFGLTEPRRPLIAPEAEPLPADLERYQAAMRSGERDRIDAIVHPDAHLRSPRGPIERQRFVDNFSTKPEFGAPGVPLQFCTVTSDGDSHATEFISWRRPPHGGLSVYTFQDGLLMTMRMYEGPVYR